MTHLANYTQQEFGGYKKKNTKKQKQNMCEPFNTYIVHILVRFMFAIAKNK